MNGWSAWERFLRTDPSDPGCGGAMEIMDVYAELAVAGGPAAEQRYPGVAAHQQGQPRPNHSRLTFMRAMVRYHRIGHCVPLVTRFARWAPALPNS
jgi:hypothetical protein